MDGNNAINASVECSTLLSRLHTVHLLKFYIRLISRAIKFFDAKSLWLDWFSHDFFVVERNKESVDRR